MKTGKLTPQELNEIVFSRLPPLGPGIVCGPGNGLDCAVIECPEGSRLIMSSDPITGASKDIGRLAVHVSCNDLAAFGVKPEAIMLVLIAPVTAVREQLNEIMDQVASACNELGTSVAGGHTEISDAVNRFLLTATSVGFATGDLIKSNGARPGDSLIMTKTAGLEGTAIIAADFPDKLAGCLSEAEIAAAASMIDQISVVPEGLCGRRAEVHAMHDVTEGGIMGAAWEMADAAGLGLKIRQEAVLVDDLTARICDIVGIDPYRLISSGSMLMATDKPELLQKERAAEGIAAAEIGCFTESSDRVIEFQEELLPLEQPDRDELYKLV
ncbi:MAG: hypothetical protein GX028_10085 [Clostridiaceae bacterium]|nr:hypothetical protein [Clostridiaceae bacterium]